MLGTITASLTTCVCILTNIAVLIYALPAYRATRKSAFALVAVGAVLFTLYEAGHLILREYHLSISRDQHETIFNLLNVFFIGGLITNTWGFISICNEAVEKQPESPPPIKSES